MWEICLIKIFNDLFANKYFLIIVISFIWYGWGLIYNGSQNYGAISDFNSYFRYSIEIFTHKDLLEAISSYTGAMNPFFFIIMGWVARFLGSDLIVFQIFNIIITLPIFPAIFYLAKKHDYSDESSFLIAISFIFSYSLRASVLGINTDHFAFICMFWSYYFFSSKLLPLKVSSIVSILFAFLAFYTRQFYAPFVFLLVYLNFCENTEKWYWVQLLVFSLLMSLPELYLVITWGSFLTPGFHHHFKIDEIPKNIAYFFAVIILLTTPFLIIKYNFEILTKDFYRKRTKIFIFSLVALSLGVLYSSTDTTMMGGGLLTVPIKFLGHDSFITKVYTSLLIFIGLWIMVSSNTKLSIVSIFLLSPVVVSSIVFFRYFEPYIFFILIFTAKRVQVKHEELDFTQVKYLPYFQLLIFAIIFTSQMLKEFYSVVFRS